MDGPGRRHRADDRARLPCGDPLHRPQPRRPGRLVRHRERRTHHGLRAIYAGFVIAWSILWDDGAHVRLYTQIMQMIHGDEGRQVKWIGNKDVGGWAPGQLGNFIDRIWQLIFLPNRPAISEAYHFSIPIPSSLQAGGGVHDGALDWPEDFRNIPVPLKWHLAVEVGRAELDAWVDAPRLLVRQLTSTSRRSCRPS